MTSAARNRSAPFGTGGRPSNNENSRLAATGFGSGFGTGNNTWTGGIWSNKAIGSGFKSNGQDLSRLQDNASDPSASREAITGSGSLLPSSESDSYNTKHGSWDSVDETSPALSRVQTNHSNPSPAIRQPGGNQLLATTFDNSNPSHFASISSRSSQKNFLDPSSGNLDGSSGFDINTHNRSSRHNSDEENRFNTRKLNFESGDNGRAMHLGRPSLSGNASGYNSSVASRAGSQPPSRADLDQTTRRPGDIQGNPTPRYSQSMTQNYRSNLSSQAQGYHMPSSQQRNADQMSQAQLNQLLGEFGNLTVGRDAHNSYATYRNSQQPDLPDPVNDYRQDNISGGGEPWSREEEVYSRQQPQPQFSVMSSMSGVNPNSRGHRGIPFSNQYSNSPLSNDTRFGQQSPYYSASSTPPGHQHRGPSRGGHRGGLVQGEAAVLDIKLRGVQQEQQAYVMPQNQMRFRNPLADQNVYDFQQQGVLRQNGLGVYYPMPPPQNLLAGSQIPRGPARDHDLVQPVRSPLLEEFRNNSKTNKRYELKDIYEHIVEFSGDQHGSRFIQQKLETANSDEKNQVFKELKPNAIQLMTDVFGNYVIQKFFEHGNQSQKKVLANQMKGHILSLSRQMYGCRVVQKALEHILTDQQAQLVKELEHDVILCVKDQNGNHVVQKAIERVPAEHIQFIINAFTGQVQALATHSYGCRVVQRMLEHCEEPTRSSILAELHACAASLIVDQFGNYVTQHVIEHGADEDRSKLVTLVIGQLLNFSKHKFASNVVEKSIEFGSKEQRRQIVDILTAVNDITGESPSSTLIRDQYGNYVIQKLLNTLKDEERDEFVDLIKAQINILKAYSYGKQIAAIEKLIYTSAFPTLQSSGSVLSGPDTSAAPTPPLTTGAAQSPQSSLPSTHANSVDESHSHDESRKSSGSNAVNVLTPTSTNHEVISPPFTAT